MQAGTRDRTGEQLGEPAFAKVPEHIAIIMDGNGRWARERGWPRLRGHRAGTENIRRIIDYLIAHEYLQWRPSGWTADMERIRSPRIPGGISSILMERVDALTPEQRQVVILTYFEGRSYQEIARIAGCPVNTVKTRMFHARRRLRSLLSDRRSAA